MKPRYAAALGALFGLGAPIIVTLAAHYSMSAAKLGPWVWPSGAMLIFLGYGRWSPMMIDIVVAVSIAMNVLSFGVAGIIIAFGCRALFGEDDLEASLRKRH